MLTLDFESYLSLNVHKYWAEVNGHSAHFSLVSSSFILLFSITASLVILYILAFTQMFSKNVETLSVSQVYK